MSTNFQGSTLTASKRGASTKPLLNYTSSVEKKKKGNVTPFRKTGTTAANMSNGLSSRTSSAKAPQSHRLKPEEVNLKMNRPPDIQPVRGGNMNMNRITPQYIESFWLHLKQETDNFKSHRREQSPVLHKAAVGSDSNTQGLGSAGGTALAAENTRNSSVKSRPVVNTTTQRRIATPTNAAKGAAPRIPSPNTSVSINYSTSTNTPGGKMTKRNGGTPKSSSRAAVSNSPSEAASLINASSRTLSASKSNRASPSVRSLSGSSMTATRSLTPAGLHSPYKAVVENGRLGTPPRDHGSRRPPSATNAATELLRSLTNKYIYCQPGYGMPLGELQKKPNSSAFANGTTTNKTSSFKNSRPVVAESKSAKKPPVPKFTRAKSAPLKKDVRKAV